MGKLLWANQEFPLDFHAPQPSASASCRLAGALPANSWWSGRELADAGGKRHGAAALWGDGASHCSATREWVERGPSGTVPHL